MTTGPCNCPPFTGCECGITDGFTRSGALGTADCGLVYVVGGGDLADWTLDGTKASVSSAVAFDTVLLNFLGQSSQTVAVTSQVTASAAGDNAGDYVTLGMDTSFGGYFVEVDFATDGTVRLITDAGTATTTLGFTARTLHKMRVGTDGVNNARCKVWLASDPEPAAWLLTQAFGGPVPTFDIDLFFGVATGATLSGTFAALDATGVTRCALVGFDDFSLRTEAPGTWGQATPGGEVWVETAGANSSIYVTGGYGTIENGSAVTLSDATIETDPGLPPNGNFTCTVRLRLTSDLNVLSAEFIFDGFLFGWTHAFGAPPTLELDDSQGGGGGGLVTVLFDPAFWASLAGIGIMKAERIGGTARMKLWDSAQPEPDWQLSGISLTKTLPIVQKGLALGTLLNSLGGRGTQQIQIASIDLGWVSRPCSPGGIPAAPVVNQPVQDERIGYGDGTTVIFSTAYPYVPSSLQVQVAGMLSEVDNTNPAAGAFTLVNPAPAGAEIHATYRAAGG